MGKKLQKYRGGNDEFKELAYKLNKKGFVCVPAKGSHFKFINKKTGQTITANKNLNAMVAKRLEKESMNFQTN